MSATGGLTARRGHEKPRQGQKVERGENLSDHAQLLTPLSFMHMQRIHKAIFLFLYNLKHLIKTKLQVICVACVGHMP